jgi:hypothetical protein
MMNEDAFVQKKYSCLVSIRDVRKFGRLFEPIRIFSMHVMRIMSLMNHES